MRGVKQTLSFQAGAQAQKFLIERTFASWAQCIHIKLHLPLGGIDAQSAVGFHEHAIRGSKAQPHR